MAKMVGQIVYMLSNWDQCVSYVRIVRHNFAYSPLGRDDRQVTGKMIRDSPHKVSGLQKIANSPANNQSDLDPIFSKVRRLGRVRIVLGKPGRPSVKAPNLRQAPARILDASRDRPVSYPRRGVRFQVREKFFCSTANISLHRSWQILQPLPSKTFDPGQLILQVQVISESCEHPIANIYEISLPRREFSLRLKK